MSAMPLPFLLNRAAGLISMLILFSGLWFAAEWMSNESRSSFWLVTGLTLLVIAGAGRALVSLTMRQHGERVYAWPPVSEVEAVTGCAGARLHVRCFGPAGAPAIILTHAWGMDGSFWQAVTPTLAQRYRVFVWDLPGLGRSGRPFDGVYAVDRFAQDLRSVMELAGEAPTVLVGHGTGATIVLACCSHYPELMQRRIAGVALLNGADAPLIEASGDSTFLRSVRKPLLEPLIRLSIAASPLVHLFAWASYLNGLAVLITRAFGFGPDPARRDVDCTAWLSTRQAPSVLAKGLRALLEWDGAGVAGEVTVPLLTASASADLLIKPAESAATAKAAPFGRHVEIEAAGHMGLLERPEVYADVLKEHAERAFDRARRASSHAAVLAQAKDAIEPLAESRSFADQPDATGARDSADIASQQGRPWQTGPHGHA
ncbi:MAG: alpha/beta hydrolase [Proteobacteria bacterium]|nr:alpha/beta hydrolase [Pseudomonadota bacterium]